jgi:hypothetical protein
MCPVCTLGSAGRTACATVAEWGVRFAGYLLILAEWQGYSLTVINAS